MQIRIYTHFAITPAPFFLFYRARSTPHLQHIACRCQSKVNKYLFPNHFTSCAIIRLRKYIALAPGWKGLIMSEKKIGTQSYVDKPNLLRVATEIATFENPYKVAQDLLALIKSSTKDSGN